MPVVRENCSACGGSGLFGSHANGQKCQHCYGYGYKDVNKPSSDSGSGNPSCFPANTKILTPSGWQDIQNMKRHDSIQSISSKGKITTKWVIQKKTHSPRKIFEVQTSQKDFTVRATDNHALKTTRGWVKVHNLVRGDIIYRINAEGETTQHQIIQVIDTGKTEPVYNLVVTQHFSFVADGFIAHSFSRFRIVQMAFYTALELFLKPKKVKSYGVLKF